MATLLHFIRARREEINGAGNGVRILHRTEVLREVGALKVDRYFAEKAPFFYRSQEAIIADIRDGFFLTAFESTLAKLPTVSSFQESHFGEIVAGIFCKDVLGLETLYSKLSFLSAENTNAYKMDLVMYETNSDPVNFVLGEVKCSPKSHSPAKHDESCFPDLFASFNTYVDADYNFDLTAARDRLTALPPDLQTRIRNSLLPYGGGKVSYAGFAVIDLSTFSTGEAQVLRTRKNDKAFEVDLICLEAFAEVAEAVYGDLHSLVKRKPQ